MGVERSTLRRTIQVLTADGLLESRRGRYGGTWVALDASPLPKQQSRPSANGTLDSYQHLERLAIVGTTSKRCSDCNGPLLIELETADSANAIRWAKNRLRWHVWVHAERRRLCNPRCTDAAPSPGAARYAERSTLGFGLSTRGCHGSTITER